MEIAKLDDIIARIVEVADPERIVLFGSAARGTMGPHSDIDLLVIVPGNIHRGRLTEDIYMNLIGVGQAVDVIVVTPEEVERHRDSHSLIISSLIISSALKDGRVVYDASKQAIA